MTFTNFMCVLAGEKTTTKAKTITEALALLTPLPAATAIAA